MLIHDYLEYWAHRAPQRECVGDGQRVLTYHEVDEQADRFAHTLAALGVGDGDRLAVLAKNCLEWAVIYAGAFKAGVVPVPLNYRHHPQEWIHPVTDSGATVFLAQQLYADGVDGIRGELPKVDSYVLLDGTRPGWAAPTRAGSRPSTGLCRTPARARGPGWPRRCRGCRGRTGRRRSCQRRRRGSRLDR